LVNEASIAEVEAAIEASNFATSFAIDGDGLIVLWIDPDADLHISLATITMNVNGTDIDRAVLTNIAIFVGNYTLADLTTESFHFFSFDR